MDKIITDRRNANPDELARTSFSELSEMYGIDVTPKQGLFSYRLPDGIDEMPLTIIELNDKTLTENGKTEWSDVLNAGVKRIYQGYYGLQIDLTGVKASRIYDFSAMLAGYCSIEDYYKWVRDDSFLPGNKMTFD